MSDLTFPDGTPEDFKEMARKIKAMGALYRKDAGRAYRRLGYSLSNPSISKTDPPLPEQESPEMEKGSYPRRSSGLRV